MSKLKIVHISTYFNGGAGRAAYRIHKALLNNGVDSYFLNIETVGNKDLKNVFLETVRPDAIVKPPGFVKRQKNRIRFRIKKHLGFAIIEQKRVIVDFQRFNLKLNCEFASLPFSNYKILENPLLKDADIIHLHWIAEMLDYPTFFQNNKKPIVWTLHDMNPFQGIFHYKEDEKKNDNAIGSLDKKVRGIKNRVIKKRKKDIVIVTPSYWLLKEAMNSQIFKNTENYCIPYPIDTYLFTPQQNNDFKNSNNIPQENTILLFVADYVNKYRKGFDLLLNALKNVSTKFTLVILGNAENYDISGLDVRIVGVVKDDKKLNEFYSLADAVVIPSREDNLPNVMLESLSCGTPVIAFPIGGFKDHIINYETGLLCRGTSSKDLAIAIETFAKNKNLFNKEHIQNYAKEKFNEKSIADQYIKVYNKIIEDGFS